MQTTINQTNDMNTPKIAFLLCLISFSHFPYTNNVYVKNKLITKTIIKVSTDNIANVLINDAVAHNAPINSNRKCITLATNINLFFLICGLLFLYSSMYNTPNKK